MGSTSSEEAKTSTSLSPGDEFDVAILDIAEHLKTSGNVSPRKSEQVHAPLFSDVQDYTRTYLELILEECKAILLAAWQDANSKALETESKNMTRALGCDVNVCYPGASDRFCPLEVVKPRSCRASFDVGKVVFLQGGDVTRGAAIVEAHCGDSYVFRTSLRTELHSGKYDLLILENMTTARRGYVSLFSLPELSSPLRRQILNPVVNLAQVSWLQDKRLCELALAGDNSFLVRTKLNTQQRLGVLAVQRLQRGFFLVQGPPGTGKTTTILGMVSAVLNDNPNTTVLVCAPSNAAVDEVASRMMTGLYDQRGNSRSLPRGFMVRLGPRASISKKCYEITLDALVQDRSHFAGEDVEKRVLKNASIICTTLSFCGYWLLDQLNLKFDLVIIDEAVQGVEPEILIALARAKQRCVMVGDPRQLPATVFQLPDLAFRRSLFERMQEAGVVSHLLDTQYRMHTLISHFPAAYFYNGALKDAPEIQTRKSIFDLDTPHRFIRAGGLRFRLEHYVFLDVAWGLDELDDEGHSRFNNEEAKAVASVVGAVLKNVQGEVTVGVVTPYASQRTVILNLLTAPERDCCEVNTIDGFQGRETDVIILSCVRAQRRQGIGFISDERRMNVALTRAKWLLIVIGHSETLERRSGAWRALIQDARLRGLYQTLSKSEPYEPVSEFVKDNVRLRLEENTYGASNNQPSECKKDRNERKEYNDAQSPQKYVPSLAGEQLNRERSDREAQQEHIHVKKEAESDKRTRKKSLASDLRGDYEHQHKPSDEKAAQVFQDQAPDGLRLSQQDKVLNTRPSSADDFNYRRRYISRESKRGMDKDVVADEERTNQECFEWQWAKKRRKGDPSESKEVHRCSSSGQNEKRPSRSVKFISPRSALPDNAHWSDLQQHIRKRLGSDQRHNESRRNNAALESRSAEAETSESRKKRSKGFQSGDNKAAMKQPCPRDEQEQKPVDAKKRGGYKSDERRAMRPELPRDDKRSSGDVKRTKGNDGVVESDTGASEATLKRRARRLRQKQRLREAAFQTKVI